MQEVILEFLSANQGVVIGAAAIIGVLYVYWDNLDQRAFEKFETKPLSQKVIEDLKYRVPKMGKTTSRELTQDRDHIGHVRFFDTYEMPSDEIIAPGTEIASLDETDEVYVFMEAPSKQGITGQIEYYIWFLKDYLTEGGDADIFIIDKESVEKTRHEFIIDPDVQFLPTTYAGVMVQNSRPSTNVVQQIVTLDAEGQITNSLSEFLSKVEHFEIEHLKKLNQLEKEGEIEQQRNEGMFRNS